MTVTSSPVLDYLFPDSPLDCLPAKAGGAVNGGAVRAVHLDR